MAVLRAVDITPEERRAYLKHAAAMRRAVGEGGEEEPEAAAVDDGDDEGSGEAALSVERIVHLDANAEQVLTVDSEGYGKRTLAYDYRRTGRGGQGLIAHDLSRGGRIVAGMPVEPHDQILLVADSGQLIRAPVGGIRIASRNTRGVIIFRTGEGEHVVAVERIEGVQGEDEDLGEDGDAGDAAPDEAGDAEA
jgi:DNA gyrase subunit A